MSKQQPTARQQIKKPVPAPVKAGSTPSKAPAKPAAKPINNTARAPGKPGTTNTPARAASNIGAKKPIPQPAKQTQTKAPATLPKKPVTTVSKAPAKPSTPAAKPAAAAKPAEQQEGYTTQAGNWISRTIQGQVQAAGDYAGGFVNSIGDRVDKFGQSVGDNISNRTRVWGEGVSGYGNDIKDKVGVGGPRVATAGNPLGMAGVGAGKAITPAAGKKGGNPNQPVKQSAGNPLGLG